MTIKMMEKLDSAVLKGVTDSMIDALTNPAFVESMRVLNTTPQEKRQEIGAEILNPEALRKKGVPLPEEMRVTSRYFEEGVGSIEVSEDDDGQLSVNSTLSKKSKNALLSTGATTYGGCCCGTIGGTGGGCGGALL